VFDTKITKSEDLSDHLQDLVEYLKVCTNATGVYIGELIKPKKQI